MSLILRKYKTSDLINHFKLLKMNGAYKKFTPKIKNNEKLWLDKSIKNYNLKNPDYFVLAITFDCELIGNVILEKIDFKKNKGNVGYWIGKRWQGEGYATKALEMFLKKVEKKFKIKKVHAETKVKNVGSQKVLEKNDFKKLRKVKGIIYWAKDLNKDIL